MRRHTTLTIACVTLIGTAACDSSMTGISDTASVPAKQLLAGKIVFSTPSANGAGSDLAAIDTAGGNIVRITDDDTDDQCPRISPDGKTIAVRRSGQLWTMRDDGSWLAQMQAPAEAGDALSCPVWSADSRSIAFSAHVTPSTVKTSIPSTLLIGDAATGNVRTVLSDYNIAVFEWSADNRRIAFTTNLNGGNGYFNLKWNLVDPIGSNRVQVAEDYWSISLSPQVDRIVRDCWISSTVVGICTSASDGSDLKLIARDAVAPLWSPDGAMIAYVAAYTLGVVTPDGSDNKAISDNRTEDFAWIGSTHRIVYSCRRKGPNSQFVADVCITDADAPGPPRYLGIVGASFSTPR